MRYFIIAGEQSGDLHGANLVRELLVADPEADVHCWGGDLMQSAGARLLMHYSRTAFMGFVEVIRNLRTINKNLSICRDQIMRVRPDVVILIDYPGFNLRIAEFASKSGFLVYYYISPKLWAWNENRIRKIRKFVDRMYIIFPFEVEFYKKHNIEVKYRGNPVIDEIEKRKFSIGEKEAIKRSLGLDERPVIGILAGSRKNEVRHILPVMLSIVDSYPEYQFVIAGVSNLQDGLYYRYIGNKLVKLIKGRTYEILHISEAALVASGTATLETALMNVPQVVCFRGDFFSMLIASFVIKVKYISLVNLIMGYEVVKELVQYSLNRKNLKSELTSLLPDNPEREKMLLSYKDLRAKLGQAGASQRIAIDMAEHLKYQTGKQTFTADSIDRKR